MKNKLLKILSLVLFLVLLVHVNVQATTLTLTTATDKNNYIVGDVVTTTISWNTGMQAAGFTVEFDEEYLTFTEASIDDNYYKIGNGKINISWASFDEIDFYNMTFKFSTIKEGNTQISVKNPYSFADGNLTSPDGYDCTTSGIKQISIEKPTYIKDNSIKISTVSNKLVLSGFNYSKDTYYKLSSLKSVFEDGITVKVFNLKGNEITSDSALIGTGTSVKLYKNSVLQKEYEIVIYGDTTGDGKINAIDALAMIKHINEKIIFTNEFFVEAGRVREESGVNISAVDALAIIKYTNDKYSITQ